MEMRENDFIISNIQDRLNRILVKLNELSCMENPRMELTLSHIIYHLDSLCRDILSFHIWVTFHHRVVQCVINAWQILRSQVECDKEDVDGTECTTNHVYTGIVGRPRLAISYDQILSLLGMYYLYILHTYILHILPSPI